MQAIPSSLTRIISHAIETARSEGLDYVGQTERAMRAILMVEPDLAPGAARRIAETLRQD